MLRSGAPSAGRRFVLHAVAVGTLALFAWMLFYVVRIAVRADDARVRVWMGGVAVVALALVGVSAVYVRRSPHSGGYAIVSLAAMAATFVCFIGLGSLVAF